jgi:hypothetical protein
MKASIVVENDGIKFIQQKINDRKHWIIIGASPMGMDMMRIIEETFYDGENGNDFEVAIFSPLIAIAVADKRHMTLKQLAKLVDGDEKALAGHDVIITPDVPKAAFKWFGKTFYSDYLN